MKKSSLLAAMLVVGSALPASARAQECPVNTLNGIPAAKIIKVDDASTAGAEYCGTSAGFTNQVRVVAPNGDLRVLFTGHQTPSGTTADLGVYAAGAELVFTVRVLNNGLVYSSGPAERNPDGVVHAAVKQIADGVYNVGFEDTFGGGDRDYNDITFNVEVNAVVVPPDDTDTDGDGVPDYDDNCVFDDNAGQADVDGDDIGDVCDTCTDVDGDAACDDVDTCPGLFDPEQLDTDEDDLGDACDLCPADPLNDVDEDDVCGDVDNCELDANPSQADADEDDLGDACDACAHDPDNDADADGVCGDVDACADTGPELAPTDRLVTWRWADLDGDGLFDTVASRGRGPGRSYTIEDTAGCSCTQIIEALDLGRGHLEHGCSISAMDDWTALVAP